MPPLAASGPSPETAGTSGALSRLGTFMSDARNRLTSVATPPIDRREIATSIGSASRSASRLVRRQQVIAIPSTYSDMDRGPAPGTVIGIVFGSVAGFILLLWLLYTCFNMRGGAVVAEEDVIVHERRASRSSRRAETAEMSRSSRSRSPMPRSPVRAESRTERVIVEERRVPVAVPVVERDDDVVEVIEEHSPPRRSRSGRNRPHSGYRAVDPDRYAGGNYPVEEVYSVKRSPRRR